MQAELRADTVSIALETGTFRYQYSYYYPSEGQGWWAVQAGKWLGCRSLFGARDEPEDTIPGHTHWRPGRRERSADRRWMTGIWFGWRMGYHFLSRGLYRLGFVHSPKQVRNRRSKSDQNHPATQARRPCQLLVTIDLFILRFLRQFDIFQSVNVVQ